MKKIIINMLIITMMLPINAKSLTLNTESIIAMDMKSGRIFYEKNSNDKRLIASTTKIMTAVVAIENSNLTDVVKIDESILDMYGSNIYIELNENILLLDLLYGLMLRSGNDAAIAIAKYVGTSVDNFVKMMNNKAKELDMSDTIYNNPHGLDDDTKNYSTAIDLAKLYAYAYQNKIFKSIVGTKTYNTKSNLKSYEWQNKTKILSLYEKATGGKTGYTPAAKRVLVTSASNNDIDVVISSFNSIYDYDLHINIYNDIFSTYKNTLIIDKNNFSLDYDIENMYIKESFYYPLSTDERKDITTKVELKKDKESIGNMYVYLNNDIIKKICIYSNPTKDSLFTKIKNFFINLIA